MLCVIVDDEIISINYLEKIVLQIPQLKLVATFKNPVSAKAYLLAHPEVYLVFSDINMSGLSGLELAQLVPKKKVVFTTGYEEYARESWRISNAIGYLSKPISLKDISEVAEKIHPIYLAERIALVYKNTTHLVYRLDDKTVEIAFDKILYIESTGNFSNVIAEDGDYFAPIPLWEVHKALPSTTFARVSKSTVANKDKILGATNNYKELKLLGGSKCKSSKMYLQNSDLLTT
ncbi:LytTR family two component transcriptional regulator [Taibaiella chishuiensis]|uniref:LytTR family two component transcriptional regulator n=2 Tax=Taibaiella chishuiensis TaxID=1434707 RepID=A0A2P8D7I4_9BACT|nr:LytTR family two component transcriptional regulator [Taibaiella chishuiensis]